MVNGLLRIILYSSVRSAIKNTLNLVVNNKNSECFILGNGPSLKNFLTIADSKLQKRNLFVTNSFSSSAFFTKLKPHFYVLADPVFWNNQLQEETNKVFNSIIKYTSWKMKLFVPIFAKKTNFFEKLSISNPNIEIIYYNAVHFKDTFKKITHLLYKLNLVMPCPQNVIISCIFIALNSGFKKIYIAGSDHSWHENIIVSKDNILYIQESYNSINQNTKTSPLLHPDGSNFKMDDFFLALSIMFKAHRNLEDYSKSLGAKIINTSTKSFIDAYERINLEKII
jgi:hypothetical protein